MPKPQRIALDLSLLLDLASEDQAAWDAIEIIRGDGKAEFIIPPAVQLALALAFVRNPQGRELQRRAAIALSWLKSKWKFTDGLIIPGDLWVSGGNADAMIAEGLLPQEAFHSANTIAESAALGCQVLLAHDEELLAVPYAKLKRFLVKFHREPLWITFPEEMRARLEGT